MKQSGGTFTSVGIVVLYFADKIQQADSEEPSGI